MGRVGPRFGSGQTFCRQSRVGSGRVGSKFRRVGSGPRKVTRGQLCGATPSLNPISATASCMPGVLHHHMASFTNCVIPQLSHLRTRLQCLYFPSYFIRYCHLKFSISNLWSAHNIINQRPVPDSKKFKNH